MSKSLVWAHRGASAYAPDNSMPAFELAVKMMSDGIEIDTHLSKDGIPVLCHDDVLDNTSDGAGRVRDHTLDELRRLNFNRNFPELGRVGIVTLEECYLFAKKNGLFVNNEIKHYDDENWEELNEQVLKAAIKTGMEDSILYSGFWHDRLSELKKKAPDTRSGLLYMDYIEAPWDYAKEYNADALHPEYCRILEQDYISRCHRAGILVNPWTIDEREKIENALKLGSDAIISNRPDLVRNILDHLKM